MPTGGLDAQFKRIADAIEQRQPDSHVVEALTAAHALCVTAAAHAQTAQIRTVLTNVQTALDTWRTVWPRLGTRTEFRQAVAREAGLWARKLGELANTR